jgi:hypothetical protein
LLVGSYPHDPKQKDSIVVELFFKKMNINMDALFTKVDFNNNNNNGGEDKEKKEATSVKAAKAFAWGLSGATKLGSKSAHMEPSTNLVVLQNYWADNVFEPVKGCAVEVSAESPLTTEILQLQRPIIYLVKKDIKPNRRSNLKEFKEDNESIFIERSKNLKHIKAESPLIKTIKTEKGKYVDEEAWNAGIGKGLVGIFKYNEAFEEDKDGGSKPSSSASSYSPSPLSSSSSFTLVPKKPNIKYAAVVICSLERTYDHIIQTWTDKLTKANQAENGKITCKDYLEDGEVVKVHNDLLRNAKRLMKTLSSCMGFECESESDRDCLYAAYYRTHTCAQMAVIEKKKGDFYQISNCSCLTEPKGEADKDGQLLEKRGEGEKEAEERQSTGSLKMGTGETRNTSDETQPKQTVIHYSGASSIRSKSDTAMLLLNPNAGFILMEKSLRSDIPLHAIPNGLPRSNVMLCECGKDGRCRWLTEDHRKEDEQKNRETYIEKTAADDEDGEEKEGDEDNQKKEPNSPIFKWASPHVFLHEDIKVEDFINNWISFYRSPTRTPQITAFKPFKVLVVDGDFDNKENSCSNYSDE